MKRLAIGMAFAVLIDASLVRMILVPSVMALLGARAWWMPRWLVSGRTVSGWRRIRLPGPAHSHDEPSLIRIKPALR